MRHSGARALAACLAVLGVLGACPRAAERDDAVHRYRISGKIRLLLFWVGSSDVGDARVTWRTGEADPSIGLLIGSDPRRAPRAVNEWGYVREDVGADETRVFGIRTVSGGDSPDAAEARRTGGGLAELGVLCSHVSPLAAASRTTTVFAGRDVTYRDVDRVLDIVERREQWNERTIARPPGAAPGFLTALDRLMRETALAASESAAVPASPTLTYVYKDAVYDLVPRRVERVPELRTRSGVVVHNLLRGDIAVKDRATGSTTVFSITYGVEGAFAGVPVAARYQPNWWFKVELELDDAKEVPPDPVDDASLRERIDALCAPPPAE